MELELGRGGAGVVYRAVDRETSRRVALKVLSPSDHPSDRARFEREVAALSSIRHPNVVELLGSGLLPEGGCYLAMEWIDGPTLAERQRSPVSLLDALDIARGIAVALAATHGAGVVHRDVKPANVLLARDASGALLPKLIDFGVASTSADGDGEISLGEMVGTPAYMAPEQARGETVDLRADLFSLGAVLFETIAGRPPHVGPSTIATLARLVTTEAPRLSEVVAGVPARLDDLVASLLSAPPSGRPASAEIVAAELAELRRDPLPSSTLAPPTSATPSSVALSVGSRLVTTIVCLDLRDIEERSAALQDLGAKGALPAPVGRTGLVAHLGALQATGDEAGQAVEVALSLAKAGGRVGVATGRSRLQHAKPVGEVVDRASTLAREAAAGHVLADTTTAELLRGRYDLTQRGSGSALVRGAREGRREGGGAPFIGREAELARALGAYERSAEAATPVVASIIGPPGIGKTRLGREALARISASAVQPRAVVVRCELFAAAHALSIAAEVLRGVIGSSKGAPLAEVLTAIERRAEGAPGRSDRPSRELVARLLANEALDERARDGLWLAMSDVFLALTERPLALVIEDAQWADRESIAWLDHVLELAEHRALFLLVLARPSFYRDHPRAFVAREHVRVELRPVSKKAARAIAKAMLATRATDEVLDRIAEQADGSPLFAEELARLTAAGRDASTAPTIEAAIQASLDALDPALHEAALRLSTFGLFGWDGGLRALGVERATECLEGLASSEIVIEHAETRFARHREWGFKHALVREVAYASLSVDAKRALHASVARWLVEQGEDSATVARHFELGGEDDLAGVHWERAARRALDTNALSDAVAMSERALAFAYEPETAFPRALLLDEAFSRVDARSSERETSVRALVENAHDDATQVLADGARARYDDARGAGEHIFERLQEVRDGAARLELWDEEARCSAALAARYAFAGRFAEAEREARRLLETAERRSHASAAVDAWQTLGIVRQTRGELLAALAARRSAAGAAAAGGLKVREATLTINVGFALTTIGAQREARAALEQGLALASAVVSAGVVELGKMLLLGWAATFGSEPTLDRALADTRARADAAAEARWTPNDRVTVGISFYRGVELLRQGGAAAAARARKLLAAAAEAYRATEMRDVLPVALGEWAEAERRLGDVAAAVRLATEAAELLDHSAMSLLNEAPVYLALHDALVDAGLPERAKSAIVRAMPALGRRVTGLRGSPYQLGFLTRLPHNAALLTAADAYGLVPREIEAVLERAVR